MLSPEPDLRSAGRVVCSQDSWAGLRVCRVWGIEGSLVVIPPAIFFMGDKIIGSDF